MRGRDLFLLAVLARLVFGSLTLLISIPLLRNRVLELLPDTQDGASLSKHLTSLRWPLLFLGAMLLGSLSYAVGNVYARRRLEGVPVLVSAVGQNLCGVLVVLPFALAFGLPEELPGLGTVAALVGLGAGGTGIAYLLYFGLIARVGATKTSTVAYLMPAIALFYGAVFLGEAFTLRALVGLALILASVAGVTGALCLPKRLRREPPAP